MCIHIYIYTYIYTLCISHCMYNYICIIYVYIIYINCIYKWNLSSPCVSTLLIDSLSAEPQGSLCLAQITELPVV